MAETSEGWDGTVDEAAIARILHAATPPRIESGFTLATVAGARRVILAPGVAHHAFVRYENTSSTQLDLATPGAGSGRWYLLVHRRDWPTNRVTTVLIPGDTTGTDVPTAPPTSYPGALATAPGIAVDHPLHWVWVRSSDTTVRTWPVANGRPYPVRAAAVAAESYSDFIDRAAEKAVLTFSLPTIQAGALLRIWTQLDIYCPAGDVGGRIRVVRYTNAAPVELGTVRWHTHSRGDRWLKPTIDLPIVVSQQLDSGTLIGVLVSNDPLSAGAIEAWQPSGSWFTS